MTKAVVGVSFRKMYAIFPFLSQRINFFYLSLTFFFSFSLSEFLFLLLPLLPPSLSTDILIQITTELFIFFKFVKYVEKRDSPYLFFMRM